MIIGNVPKRNQDNSKPVGALPRFLITQAKRLVNKSKDFWPKCIDVGPPVWYALPTTQAILLVERRLDRKRYHCQLSSRRCVLRGGFDRARAGLAEPLLRVNSEPGKFFLLSRIGHGQADSVSTRDCSGCWRKPARGIRAEDGLYGKDSRGDETPGEHHNPQAGAGKGANRMVLPFVSSLGQRHCEA